MTVVGGREVHPINVRVGGWYRAPRKRELAPLVPEARAGARDRARGGALTAGLRLPRLRAGLRARRARRSRASTRSTAAGSSRTAGLDIAVAEYDEHFVEEHVAWSNALHSHVSRARLLPVRAARALRARRRPPLAARPRGRATRPASTPSERNPFRSIVVRAVELVYAADEALRLIADYEEPDAPGVDVEPRAGVGYGCTEAPRGILYHRYEIDDDGTILDAKIVPPDLAEPADDRGGPARRRRALARPARRRARAPLRADDPQLRPLHLVRDPLPDARDRAQLSAASSASATAFAATTPSASRSRGACAGRCPRASRSSSARASRRR